MSLDNHQCIGEDAAVQGHLLERGDELDRLTRLAASTAAGSGEIVVVAGEAGIGKSRLLEATRHAAAAAGVRILTARGGELERRFAHGVIKQLFEPVVHDSPQIRQDLLGGAAAPAGALLGLDDMVDTPAVQADTEFLIQHAFYWLAVNLSAHGPLLVCVDDLHWADEPSLGWLIHLGRRLEGLPISIVLGWRSGEPGAPEHQLTALRDEADADVIHPAPLSTEACVEIVESALGNEADQRFCEACRETSGGNPFYLSELVNTLAAEHVEPVEAALDRVAALNPASVARSVLARLSRVPAAAAVARAVAVLDNDSEPRLVGALASLSAEAAGEEIDNLQRARILAGSTPLRFAHPILRTAVYGDLPGQARNALHRRAADLLIAEDRSDRAAVHLLECAPAGDAAVVALLRAAAARAGAHAAWGAAVTLLRRALREPPDPSERPALTLELGLAEHHAGHVDAPGRLQEALDVAADDAGREAVAQFLAIALTWAGRVDDGIEMLESLIASLSEDDRERRLRLEVFLVVQGAGSLRHGARVHRRLADLAAEVSGDTPAERALLAVYAFHRAHARDMPADQVAEVALRAWDGGRLLEEQGPTQAPVHLTVVALTVVDELDRARQAADAVLAEIHGSARLVSRGMAETHRGRIRWLSGDLAGAEADLRSALHVSVLTGASMETMYAVWLLCAVLLQRGKLDDVRELLAAHGILHDDPPMNMQSLTVLNARSKLHLVEGRFADAAADAQKIADAFGEAGAAVSATWSRVRVLALLGDGRADEARAVADAALELARRSHVLSEEGLALAARGLVEGKEAGITMLEDAATMMERSPRPLDRADVLLDLGGALRRAGRRAEARVPLHKALALAQASGARLIADAAELELRATGARPRRRAESGADALTPSERRIADFVAAGHTNRQIAQALFVTPKTVETHLRAIFRKLDISARTELAAKLRQGAHDVSEDGALATVLSIAATGSSASTVIREEIALHRGRQVGSSAEQVLVSFDGATRAARCALAIRAGMAGLGLEMRAGLHAGECSLVDSRLTGAAAELSPRIAGVAADGEILASSVVRDLVEGEAVSFGPPSLRGLAAGVGRDEEVTLHTVDAK